MSSLLYWIQEREKIREQKDSGVPRPWTKDPILASYRFCNVRRQDDKVTRWLADNWYPHWDTPNFVANMTIARLINESPTLEFMSQFTEFWADWFPRVLTNRLKSWRDQGNRVFNPAYIVTTCGKKMDKLDYVIRVASDVRKLPRPAPDESLASYFGLLTTVDGLGAGFLAAQIVADLKHTPLLSTAPDWHVWCAPGPGSMRGFNRLCGLAPDARKWNADEFRRHIKELQFAILSGANVSIDSQDVQNCLCEFDKYMRARDGGRPKQNYP
jgi:hypothetical protein